VAEPPRQPRSEGDARSANELRLLHQGLLLEEIIEGPIPDLTLAEIVEAFEGQGAAFGHMPGFLRDFGVK